MTTFADRYTILSADCHGGADLDTYGEYLEASWQAEFAEWRAKYENPFTDLKKREDRIRNWDNDRRNGDLDADGVAGEVVFPNTIPPFFPTASLITPPPREHNYAKRLAGIRAHNRWVADWCAEFPQRRAGMAQLFLNDIDDAIAEVEFAAANNLRGGVLLPGIPPDSDIEPLFSPRYDPLWAACADLGVVINHHSGSGSPNHGKFPASGVMWLIETPFFGNRALWHLIMSGVFHRHPKLKLVLTEQGVSWVPPLLRKLDGYHAQMAGGRVGELGFPADVVLPEKPSSYFAQNCYMGVSMPGPAEAVAMKELGLDRVMWGSDYPHHEGTYPFSRECLRRSFHSWDEVDLRQVLAGTAAEVYGFDIAAVDTAVGPVGPTVAEITVPLDELPAGSEGRSALTRE